VLFGSLKIKAQQFAGKLNPQNIIEKPIVIIDRDIFTIGENINFLIVNRAEYGNQEFNWSKVVYVELIEHNGNSIVQKKYSLEAGKANGYMKIPENISSGIYYLKTYTRWMRNFGPNLYCYVPLTIINYKKNDCLQKNISYEEAFTIDTIGYKFSNSKLLAGKNKIIKSREFLNLSVKNSEIKSLLGYSISVIPKPYFSPFQYKITPISDSIVFQLNFIPETRGVSLSGVLVEKISKVPIPNHMVSVSVLDEMAQSLSVITDSIGQFFISFPKMYDDKEVLIVSAYNEKSLNINIDNDFCTQKVHLPFIELDINNEKKTVINSLIKRSVIEQQYSKETDESVCELKMTSEEYYTEPVQSIILKDYILMPSLKDYFHELLSYANIKERKGKSYMQILGPYSDLMIYEPMVMLDNVIITDIDELLKVSPTKIERIEVFNKPYIKGNLIFGGIVNLYSYDRDLAEINLPAAGLFVNYKMLSQPLMSNPNINIPNNEPIIKNTLFWNAIDASADSISTFRFNVGQDPGNYLIIERFINNSGKLITDTTSIIIK